MTRSNNSSNNHRAFMTFVFLAAFAANAFVPQPVLVEAPRARSPAFRSPATIRRIRRRGAVFRPSLTAIKEAAVEEDGVEEVEETQQAAMADHTLPKSRGLAKKLTSMLHEIATHRAHQP
jgi:hypothetical protein